MEAMEDAGQAKRILRIRSKPQKETEQPDHASSSESPASAASTSKRSSRSRCDPEFAAKQKAFLAKVVTATNGSMDSYLSNMDEDNAVVPEAATLEPATGLKRKLSTVSKPPRAAAADPASVPASEAESPCLKRRKSSRNSTSGTQDQSQFEIINLSPSCGIKSIVKRTARISMKSRDLLKAEEPVTKREASPVKHWKVVNKLSINEPKRRWKIVPLPLSDKKPSSIKVYLTQRNEEPRDSNGNILSTIPSKPTENPYEPVKQPKIVVVNYVPDEHVESIIQDLSDFTFEAKNQRPNHDGAEINKSKMTNQKLENIEATSGHPPVLRKEDVISDIALGDHDYVIDSNTANEERNQENTIELDNSCEKWEQFSQHQVEEVLMKSFKSDPFPNDAITQELSTLTGLKVKAIQCWFEMNRSKMNISMQKAGNYFSKEQRELLFEFKEAPNQTLEEKKKLAAKTGLTIKAINAWLSRQRFKVDVSEIESTLTQVDIRLLESVFHVEASPDVEWLKKIASFTGLPLGQTQNWFKCKRSRLKQMEQNPCQIQMFPSEFPK